MMGVELVPVAGDADGMRDAALDALCRAVDVRGVYLMPSCANPTTVHMPLERRRRVAAVAERHGLVIVEDDFGGTVERLDLELGVPSRPASPTWRPSAPCTSPRPPIRCERPAHRVPRALSASGSASSMPCTT